MSDFLENGDLAVDALQVRMILYLFLLKDLNRNLKTQIIIISKILRNTVTPKNEERKLIVS